MVADFTKNGSSGSERAGAIGLLLTIAVLTFVLQFFSVHVKQTRKRNRLSRNKLFKRLGLEIKGVPRRTVIGFFHPYCNAGGGGERVLWQAVEYHLGQDPNAVVVIYSGDVAEGASLGAKEGDIERWQSGSKLPDGAMSATKEDILSKCNTRFGIALDKVEYSSRIWFLPLSNRDMVSDSYWKRLTLLGQSYGSMRLAFEACTQLLPDVFIDTMGYAFTYPIVHMFNGQLPVGGYVHYPTISTDMLQRVRERRAGHTNSSEVSNSTLRSKVKLIYYKVFAALYTRALKSSNVLVANGSWTQNHLNHLIFGSEASHSSSKKGYVQVVYPPCDTGSLSSFPLNNRGKFSIVSLAQFRPEKEHDVQLKIISELIKVRKNAGQSVEDIQLCCMGSCRDEGDERRIEGLKKLAKDLNIENHVSFVVNAPYSAILENLSTCSIGLSTMVDEHFGINVVEFMAAGLITLSHASAGPLLDIAVPAQSGQATGYHAKDKGEFVSKLQLILNLEEEKQLALRRAARARAVDIFSNRAFCRNWETHLWSRLVPVEDSIKKVQ